MALYDITLHGCDDSTTVTANLQPGDVALLERIAALTRQASAFDCQPTMTVIPHVEVTE